MIEFFRDVLSGPLYIIAAILSIILIMAIIGFIMERKKLEKEEKERIAIIDNSNNINYVNTVNNDVNISDNIGISNNVENPNNDLISDNLEYSHQFSPNIEITPSTVTPIEDIPILDDEISFYNPNEVNSVHSEVKTPIIVFEDPDQKN